MVVECVDSGSFVKHWLARAFQLTIATLLHHTHRQKPCPRLGDRFHGIGEAPSHATITMDRAHTQARCCKTGVDSAGTEAS